MTTMMQPENGKMARTYSGDLTKHISDLQQELIRSKTETQKVKTKLNCLISLIKRSWQGDRNASLHLANIVGIDISPNKTSMMDGFEGRPTSRIHETNKSKSVLNWERLSMKLLNRDFEAVESEIREHQKLYIEHRKLYLDELLQSHLRDMAHMPRNRHSKSAFIEAVDKRFLQLHSKVNPDGISKGQRPSMWTKSLQPKPPTELIPADVKLRELFTESVGHPDGGEFFPSELTNMGLGPSTSKVNVKGTLRQEAYDNSNRYKKWNIFTASELITKKERPVTAAELKVKDAIRSRPRSASVPRNVANLSNCVIGGKAFVTQPGERPLKYEVVLPPSGKNSANKKCEKNKNSNNSAICDGPLESPDLTVQDILTPEHQQHSDNHLVGDSMAPPPVSVKIENLHSQLRSADLFTEDLKRMEEMEEIFKKNTVALQKKLGIPDNGFI